MRQGAQGHVQLRHRRLVARLRHLRVVGGAAVHRQSKSERLGTASWLSDWAMPASFAMGSVVPVGADVCHTGSAERLGEGSVLCPAVVDVGSRRASVMQSLVGRSMVAHPWCADTPGSVTGSPTGRDVEGPSRKGCQLCADIPCSVTGSPSGRDADGPSRNESQHSAQGTMLNVQGVGGVLVVWAKGFEGAGSRALDGHKQVQVRRPLLHPPSSHERM